MATGTSEKRKWLFTSENDSRGNLFSKIAYANGFQACNDNDANALGPLASVMLSQYYPNDRKQSGMASNSIHNEFTDMIVLAALFHKCIDRSSEDGTKFTVARSTIFNSISQDLNDRLLNRRANVNSDLMPVIKKAVNSELESFLSKLGAEERSSLSNEVNHKLNLLEKNLNNIVVTARKTEQLEVEEEQGLQRFFDYTQMGGVALKTLITDAVMDAFKAPTEGRFAGQYTTLDKSHCAKMVWENVYRRWDSLDDHTKDFFRTFVQLHKIPANCTNGKTWEPVTDEGELSRDISSSNMCNYRINLVSKCPGSDRKLFGETLPKLPLNLVCDVWYTGSNGNVQSLKVEGNSAVTENFFRDLYNAVYHSADSASVDAKDLNVPGTFDAAKNKLTVPVFSSSRGEYVRKHLEALVNQGC
jgi:hypothetical protein